MTALSTPLSPTEATAQINVLRKRLAEYIKGKDEVLDLVLTCLLAEGHLLIEDVPGVGKTTIARALAASVRAGWRRIQFTPDLLASDITGVTIQNRDSGDFELKPGPIFTNMVIADEINRASPKTQSALLQVMEERTVSVDNRTYDVPRPFMVIATQNPIEFAGTYPLPEAQLDRFLLRITVGYPDSEAEIEVLANDQASRKLDQLDPVMGSAEVEDLIRTAAAVRVDLSLQKYIVALTAATRLSPHVRLGVSPRGSVSLQRAVRAAAVLAGRDHAKPEDIKAIAVPVLAHRIVLKREAEQRGMTGADIVTAALDQTPTHTSIFTR